MTTKIHIIRHSETDYNVEHKHDHEGKAMITQEGQRRAKKIAELLGDSHISAIYSSPLPRCIDTVTPLANQIGQTVIGDERLRETFFGPIQDRPWNDFPRDFLDEIHEINSEKREGFEHMREVRDRVSNFLDSILPLHKGENIVICSHASPILQLLAYIDSSHPDCSSDKLPNNKGVSHEDAYILREM